MWEWVMALRIEISSLRAISSSRVSFVLVTIFAA